MYLVAQKKGSEDLLYSSEPDWQMTPACRQAGLTVVTSDEAIYQRFKF
jgi:hypothetical protein